MDINLPLALIFHVCIIILSKPAQCVNLYGAQNSFAFDSQRRIRHRVIGKRSSAYSNDERFLRFRFTEEPANTVVKAGRIELNCRYFVALTDLSSHIEWRKDGAKLSELRSTGKVLLSPGSLIIENVGLTDEGIYQCVVHVTDKNGFLWTYLSRRATVRLPTLNRFEVQPQDLEAHVGQSVGFACMLKAQPLAQIEWYFNGKRINDQDDDFVIFPLNSTLEISSVLPRHQGTYHCIARNGEKSRASRNARLTLKPENSVRNDFSEPNFVLEPRGYVVNEGEPVVLECLVNGWPRPDVRWLKDSETLSLADNDRLRRIGLSSLMIPYAKAQDAGVYTCRASNSQESMDASATVQVKVAPEMTSKPKDVVAQETTDVEFTCETSGEPGPDISWYKNGETIIASEYFVVEASRLRILGLVQNDQGVYQCVAENDAGSVQASAQLIVDSSEKLLQLYALNYYAMNETAFALEETMNINYTESFSMAASSGRPKLPSEPLGVRASVVGSRFVVLTWDPPVQRHGALLAYHIFYRELDSSRERMLNSSSTSFTVTPLLPNTTYVFRVLAENEAGLGKSTSEIYITTAMEKAVPGKVRNLHAIPLSPETIEVSWEEPASNGPAPIQYKLFYIKKDHEPSEKETQIVMKKTSYTLHGMEKYAEYIIRLEAEGVNGAGLSSEPITVRTLSDLPSQAPRDVRAEAVSTTSIHVQWTHLPPEDSNGILTGYRIKYKTKLRGAKGNTLVVDGSNNSYTITGLEPGTQYMIRVAAINQNGSGPNSEWVHADTPREDKDEGQVAGTPLSLKVQPSVDSIQLSWLPPLDDSVMIRGYLIGWGINIPDVDVVKVPASLRYYTITSLKPGRDYVISLRAYNVMGNGFPIYETVRTLTPDSRTTETGQQDSEDFGLSGTPVGVRALTLSSSSIRVTWTDDEFDLAHSRHYTVRYSSSAESNGQQHFVNTTEPEVIIKGLQPNTQYEFAVRVNVGKSSSMWSMTAINSTTAAPPSSAPRDLTIMQPDSGDPQTLILNWQPPKYANGDIEEYLVYYSDRLDAPDKDWVLDGVKGDHLSIKLTNLLPRQTYFFKVQARNIKGYGPLSPTLQYVPGASPSRLFESADNDIEPPRTALLSTPIYFAIMAAVIVLLLVMLVTLVWYIKIKNGKKSAAASGYMRGKKRTGNGKGPPDLWINHHSGQQMQEPEEATLEISSVSDLKQSCDLVEMVETSQSHHCRTLQDLTIGHPMITEYRTLSKAPFSDHDNYVTSQMTQSTYGGTIQRRPVGKAEMFATYSMLPQTSQATCETEDCNDTLSRSYHQSSTSLEGRQKTPQVVYTNRGRHQIAKIDFSDHGSTYSSSQGLHSPTTPPPPPQLPNQGPPNAPPTQLLSDDGYKSLCGSSVNSNPLKSFTQLAGAPPPITPPQVCERAAHVVRPVIVASPSTRNGKPAGVVIGQKSSQVPIGRAAAQPRININNIYAPCASCTVPEKAALQRGNNIEAQQPVQASNSTEELNAQMESLDTMIDDLQALQHEFSATT